MSKKNLTKFSIYPKFGHDFYTKPYKIRQINRRQKWKKVYMRGDFTKKLFPTNKKKYKLQINFIKHFANFTQFNVKNSQNKKSKEISQIYKESSSTVMLNSLLLKHRRVKTLKNFNKFQHLFLTKLNTKVNLRANFNNNFNNDSLFNFNLKNFLHINKANKRLGLWGLFRRSFLQKIRQRNFKKKIAIKKKILKRKLSLIKAFKLLYGANRKKFFSKMLKKASIKGKLSLLDQNFRYLLKYRLNFLVYKAKWANSVKEANRQIKYKHLILNNQKTFFKNQTLKNGFELKFKVLSVLHLKLFSNLLKKINEKIQGRFKWNVLRRKQQNLKRILIKRNKKRNKRLKMPYITKYSNIKTFNTAISFKNIFKLSNSFINFSNPTQFLQGHFTKNWILTKNLLPEVRTLKAARLRRKRPYRFLSLYNNYNTQMSFRNLNTFSNSSNFFIKNFSKKYCNKGFFQSLLLQQRKFRTFYKKNRKSSIIRDSDFFEKSIMCLSNYYSFKDKKLFKKVLQPNNSAIFNESLYLHKRTSFFNTKFLYTKSRKIIAKKLENKDLKNISLFTLQKQKQKKHPLLQRNENMNNFYDVNLKIKMFSSLLLKKKTSNFFLTSLLLKQQNSKNILKNNYLTSNLSLNNINSLFFFNSFKNLKISNNLSLQFSKNNEKLLSLFKQHLPISNFVLKPKKKTKEQYLDELFDQLTNVKTLGINTNLEVLSNEIAFQKEKAKKTKNLINKELVFNQKKLKNFLSNYFLEDLSQIYLKTKLYNSNNAFNFYLNFLQNNVKINNKRSFLLNKNQYISSDIYSDFFYQYFLKGTAFFEFDSKRLVPFGFSLKTKNIKNKNTFLFFKKPLFQEGKYIF